jgi:small subunit ribosomal protein S2
VAQVGIRELLEAGVHFGHQTRRWNPKMRRFIFGERGGIHIIDLQFAANVAGRGGTILFVGTKKQARDAVKDAAEKAGMPYVNQRWLGGLLTNFQTISQRIKRLADLDRWVEDGTMELLPTRERISAMSEREKLTVNLGGVRDLQRTPDAMFVVDMKTEVIAVAEAKRLKIPIIGLVDTNCDPDPVSFVVPGNDDAIRSCKVIADAIGDVAAERASIFRAEEEESRREAEEKARAAAEETAARKEADDQARLEAEEASAQMAQAREAEMTAEMGPGQGDAARAGADSAPSVPLPVGDKGGPDPAQPPGGPEQPLEEAQAAQNPTTPEEATS